jgi:hypothetical protein
MLSRVNEMFRAILLVILLVGMLWYRPLTNIMAGAIPDSEVLLGHIAENQLFAPVHGVASTAFMVCLAAIFLTIGWSTVGHIVKVAKFEINAISTKLEKNYTLLQKEVTRQLTKVNALADQTQAVLDGLTTSLNTQHGNVWLAVQCNTKSEIDPTCTIQAPGNEATKFDLCTELGRSQWKSYVQAQMQPRLRYKDIVKHDANKKPYLRVVVNGRGWVSVRQLEQEELLYGPNAEVVGTAESPCRTKSLGLMPKRTAVSS